MRLVNYQLTSTAMWPILASFRGGLFMELFCWVVEFGNGDDIQSFVLICWCIWLARNMLIFQEKISLPKDIIAGANNLWTSFFLSSPSKQSVISILSQPSTWKLPPTGFLKINVDASVVEHLDWFSVGNVGRDHEGKVIFAAAKCLSGIFSPHIAEMLAIKRWLSIGSTISSFKLDH